mmetsp:Transcript_11066/g.32313  ORF Transcript_11066/g.32313 Transcript_11066/m.32313 type:complete len:131 (-) Transcript_11066:315-707(-)|eukprot:scaffold101747_cov45-Tisochrysis_lutea.AAC.1
MSQEGDYDGIVGVAIGRKCANVHSEETVPSRDGLATMFARARAHMGKAQSSCHTDISECRLDPECMTTIAFCRGVPYLHAMLMRDNCDQIMHITQQAAIPLVQQNQYLRKQHAACESLQFLRVYSFIQEV